MKKVIYITGSRAEFGVMQRLLELMGRNGSFDVGLIVTGMHLSLAHGSTVEEVKKSGLRIVAEVDMHIESTNDGMARSLGQGIIGITDVLRKEKPDLVMVAGDRGEALAGAIAASHLNIPVAHISGGDTTSGATIDERIRHAITKFADIHFPASESAAAFIKRMGENPELIFPVGNPGIVPRRSLKSEERRRIIETYGLATDKKIALIIQHPVTSAPGEAAKQIEETLRAAVQSKVQSVLVYPNADSGSEEMIRVIESYRDNPLIHIFKNIPRDDFLNLMQVADVMIGNSSAALIEAPTYSLPAVNIGDRQAGRERANNIIDVPHDRDAITTAIQTALSPAFRQTLENDKNPYEREGADERIIAILQGLPISSDLLKKKGRQ